MQQIRLRERNTLMDLHDTITNKKKVLRPYLRFYKKRYAQYAKEQKNTSSVEINKLIKEDWKNISVKEKKKLDD